MLKDELIKAIREKKQRWGIKDIDIASRLGVTKQYVWLVLRGNYSVSYTRLVEIDRIVNELIEIKKGARTWNEKLRVGRLVKGLTADEVAELTGYNKQSIYNWESGRVVPRAGVVRYLATLYDLSKEDVELILSEIRNEERKK